jgi:arylsulfatase A-like enzyme
MVRSGDWKLSYNHGEPPEFELYDLAADPGEFNNLAGQPAYQEVQDGLLARIMDIWKDPDSVTREVMASQEDRYLMRQVMGDAAPF